MNRLNMEGYISTHEVAKRTGFSTSYVKTQIKKGKIKAKKISVDNNLTGHQWMIREEDIEGLKKKPPKRRRTVQASKGPKQTEIKGLSTVKKELSSIKIKKESIKIFNIPNEEYRNVFRLGKRTLVVPDVHSKPDVSNERMVWLGNLILDLVPDYVVQIGDFADMPSLCSYDKGKRSFEGRRYVNDVKSVVNAQELLFDTIANYNRTKSSEEEKVNPEWILTLGNHEERINRATNEDSMLDGVLSIDDLSFQDFGWQVVPFLDVIEIEGVFFSHYFPSGLMNKPIGGMFPARSLNNKMHRSCVVGHSHVFDYDSQTLPSGQRINSLVAGCYFEHEESYVSRCVQNMWWRGVVLLDNLAGGDYSVRQIPMKEIKHRYG